MSDKKGKTLQGITRYILALTQGEGLTPERLETTAPGLVRALGENSFHGVYDIILIALDGMGRNEYRTALRSAFGLSRNADTPSARRQQLASELGITVHVARQQEKAAIKVLAHGLHSVMKVRAAQARESYGTGRRPLRER